MAPIAVQLIENIPQLRRYAWVLLGSRDQADDLVQDCLVRAIQRGHLFQPGTNLRAWLFSVMRNLLIDQKRRRASRPRLVSIDRQSPQISFQPTQTDTIELKNLLLSIDALPDNQRMAVLMVGLEGYTYEEVSTFMKVPVGTVRSRLSRGRQTLRLAMQIDGRRALSGTTKISAAPPGQPKMRLEESAMAQ